MKQQDLQELQLMISDLQNQLTCSNNERDELLAQTKTFQQLLTQKEVIYMSSGLMDGRLDHWME